MALIFYWVVFSQRNPKYLWILCCWYHPIAVSFTTKVSWEFSASGNLLGFKWLEYWFSTFYKTRWRETKDSLLYKVSLFCIVTVFFIQLVSLCYSTYFYDKLSPLSSLLWLLILLVPLWGEEQHGKFSFQCQKSGKRKSFPHRVPSTDAARAWDSTAQRPAHHLTMTNSQSTMSSYDCNANNLCNSPFQKTQRKTTHLLWA